MSEQNRSLSGYVNDMLLVETELHEAFRRQKRNDTIAQSPRAHSIIARTEDTIDQHLAALRQCLTRLGAEESALKKAVGGVMGAAAGLYDRMRGDSSVSRTLRDDYAAISFATVCYEMLHTTALAMRDVDTATMALRHLADYAPMIMELTEALPRVLVDELAADGTVAADSAVAAEAARNTKEAWSTASAAH